MQYGFADLHNHQFAQLGFGGRAFWGGAYGDIAQELRWCTPVHGPGGTQDMLSNLLRAIAYQLPAISLLGHSVGGYPQFDGWPRWDSVSHQAVFEQWLQRAVEGGLRLMVMLAVHNELFCSLANRAEDCGRSDMEAVDLQLQAARDMQAYLDAKHGGPGQGWYRIVHTPEEARTVIAAGKLAVVLGIEVDSLFNCRGAGDLTAEDLRAALDRYYALGVRHVLPIHFSNNGFGGSAFQNALQRDSGGGLISGRNPATTVGAYLIETEDARPFGYAYRTGRRNVLGLTDLGKTLIRELIARGMIIDIDHMSARAKADALDICEAAHYPVVTSHCGFVELSRGDKRHEGQLLAQEVERIRGVGGMVAVIARQGTLEEIDTWRGPGQTTVEHCCGGTANTLVQAYLYAVAKMPCVPVGIGSDFNGFAGLPGPRWGSEACPGGGRPGAIPGVTYPFIAATTGHPMDRCISGVKAFDINTDGLAHVGLLPDLIADFEAMGLTAAELEPLLTSAAGYVSVWDRARSTGLLEPSKEPPAAPADGRPGSFDGHPYCG